MLRFIIDTKIESVETRLASERILQLLLRDYAEHIICSSGKWLPVVSDINLPSWGHFLLYYKLSPSN